MPNITLSKSAIDKLMKDPTLREWREGKPQSRVPMMRYYRRCYSILHDGTIIEHGDGFSLSSIDLGDTMETTGIVIDTVAVTGELHILVGAAPAMSERFTIGWS